MRFSIQTGWAAWQHHLDSFNEPPAAEFACSAPPGITNACTRTSTHTPIYTHKHIGGMIAGPLASVKPPGLTHPRATTSSPNSRIVRATTPSMSSWELSFNLIARSSMPSTRLLSDGKAKGSEVL